MFPVEHTDAPAASVGQAKVVALILAYNVAPLLEKAVRKIPKDLVDSIFVMDDGSTDQTAQVARRLGLPVYRSEKNQGYGGNLRAGLYRALRDFDADYVVEIHGDGAQFDPAAIATALPLIEKKVPFIMGSRFVEPGRARRNGMPWFRLWANIGLSAMAKAVLRLPFTEYHSGFRIYSRSFIESLPLHRNSQTHLFSFEILAQAAYFAQDVAEVPVDADYHSEHHSIAIPEAVLFSFGNLLCMTNYVLAKSGLRYSALFPKLGT
ncbi:MAG TPA: glycosyltransferase family 2 protein [Polyangiaceae bacterium]|nr:glycosyltransferase family 2 protein [Polyangiaceae bacterium]